MESLVNIVVTDYAYIVFGEGLQVNAADRC